jgi:hypothetical protein
MEGPMRSACGFLVAILLPAVASAQSRGFPVWERPALGVFFGPSVTGDHNSNDASAEIGFVFDTPVVFGYRVRADASRVAWRFEDRDYLGALRVSDIVTLKSIRLGILRVRHAGPRTVGYAGGGFGVYRYEYATSRLDKPWRGGVHGVAGLEIMTQSQRYAFDGEVRLHEIRGPDQPPVFSYALVKLDAAIGMKVRF